MTREQDSDSTLLSEGKRKEGEMLSPRRMGEQESPVGLYSREVLGNLWHHHGKQSALFVVWLRMDTEIVHYCTST